jgi:ribosomal protein S18 acetylase RimI-like enzyme
MQTHIFRKASGTDLPAILDTCERCVNALQGRGIEQWDSRYPNSDRFTNDVTSGNLFILVSEAVVAALVVLNRQSDPEYSQVAWQGDDESAGIVHRLMVRPEFQRQGLGGRMMEEAETEARRRRHSSIRLDAYALNPAALALYEALNYVFVGTISLRRGVFRCYEKLL